jgi:hypothetical protein
MYCMKRVYETTKKIEEAVNDTIHGAC